jgi:hypothetical protein
VPGRDLPFGVAGVNGFVEAHVVVDGQGRLTQVLEENNSWSSYLSLELARWIGLIRMISGNYYNFRGEESGVASRAAETAEALCFGACPYPTTAMRTVLSYLNLANIYLCNSYCN